MNLPLLLVAKGVCFLWMWIFSLPCFLFVWVPVHTWTSAVEHAQCVTAWSLILAIFPMQTSLGSCRALAFCWSHIHFHISTLKWSHSCHHSLILIWHNYRSPSCRGEKPLLWSAFHVDDTEANTVSSTEFTNNHNKCGSDQATSDTQHGDAWGQMCVQNTHGASKHCGTWGLSWLQSINLSSLQRKNFLSNKVCCPLLLYRKGELTTTIYS